MMVLSSISYWMAFLGQMIQIDEELWAAWAITKILSVWALRNARPGKCLWRWFVCTFGPCKITLHSSCAECVQTLVQSYNVIKQASLRSMFWNNVKDIHPGKLTWNLKITHLKGKPSEPNLHFWVSAVSFRGAIQKRIVDRDPFILGFWMIWIYRAFCITPQKNRVDEIRWSWPAWCLWECNWWPTTEPRWVWMGEKPWEKRHCGETIKRPTGLSLESKSHLNKANLMSSCCFCSSLSQVGQSE